MRVLGADNVKITVENSFNWDLFNFKGKSEWENYDWPLCVSLESVDLYFNLRSCIHPLAYMHFSNTVFWIFVNLFHLLLEARTKFINFCTKFWVKRGMILASTFTGFFLRNNKEKNHYFFKTLKKECVF